MLIEDAGVTFIADDFEEEPEKSMTVVLKLAMKRVIAIAIFMRFVLCKNQYFKFAKKKLNNKYALERMLCFDIKKKNIGLGADYPYD